MAREPFFQHITRIDACRLPAGKIGNIAVKDIRRFPRTGELLERDPSGFFPVQANRIGRLVVREKRPDLGRRNTLAFQIINRFLRKG